jgi:pimeloyl-ACP methyl ester carboxylesterase
MTTKDRHVEVLAATLAGIGAVIFFGGLIVLPYYLRELFPPRDVYYQNVTLPDGISFASSRAWEKHGLQWLSQTTNEVLLRKEPPEVINSHKKFIIFIHGHEAPQPTVATYFEGLIDYYKSLRREEHHIIVYDWISVDPYIERAKQNQESYREAYDLYSICAGRTATCDADVLGQWRAASYRLDRNHAQSSGALGLVALLRIVKRDPNTAITIIGHSMGCVVIAEAMKRHPDIFSTVRNVIMLAPDVASNIFDDEIFGAAVSGIGGLHIFFSNNDNVLRVLSAGANLSGRLGALGPTGKLPLPSIVQQHDLTDIFGVNTNVHSRYLTREGASLMGLGSILH